jgi:hypothetical protein
MLTAIRQSLLRPCPGMSCETWHTQDSSVNV